MELVTGGTLESRIAQGALTTADKFDQAGR